MDAGCKIYMVPNARETHDTNLKIEITLECPHAFGPQSGYKIELRIAQDARATQVGNIEL